MPGRRALVFGATGFLGGHLVRVLAERGYRPAVFRRESSSLERLKGVRFEDIVGDLGDKDAVLSALDGRDAVFNLAAVANLLARDASARHKINTEFAANLAELMLESKRGGRLVFCSSAGAVGVSCEAKVLDENSPFTGEGIDYFRTKKAAEDAVRLRVREGLDAVIANPGTLIGPGGMKPVQAEAFRKAASSMISVYPPGGNCFTDVRDAARGMVLALEKGRPGERYLLGGTNLTFKEYFQRISRACGSRVLRFPLPARFLPAAGSLMETFTGRMGWDTGKLAVVFGYYSSEKARRELGYEITPIDSTLADILKEMRDGRGSG